MVRFKGLRFILLAPLSLIVALLLISFVYLVGVVNNQLRRLQDNVDASIKITEVFFDVLRTQAAHREALIAYETTGSEQGLRLVLQLQNRRASHLENIMGSNLLNNHQKSMIGDYQASFEALKPLDQQFFAAVQSADKMRSVMLLNSLLSLREINDARLSDLQIEARNDLLTAEHQMRDLFSRAFFFIGTVLTLAIAGLWFTAYIYRTRLLTPLHEIDRGIKHATTGDLDQRLLLNAAPDELKSLAINFNVMTGSLQRVNKDLEEAREEAMQAVEAKSKFLANMSHDIRTPMNAIIGIVELLQRSDLNESQRKQVSVLKNSSHIMLGLINDFLDHARLEAKELRLEEQVYNLRESISRVAGVIRPLAEKKGLALECNLAPDLPDALRGDSKRFEQILMNLMSNATKFTNNGYIELSVSTGENRGDQGLPTRKCLRITVKDTGVGVSSDFLPRLFDRFSQVNASSSSHLGGTGLGLSIVKQLVDLMGGTVTVESEIGRGSCFKITLPCVEGNISEIKPSLETTIERIKPADKFHRLLLVDDVSENRFLVRAFLQHSGLDIMEAENGAEAVERFEAFRPDIVLMDMRMPVLDGFAATRAIRQREAVLNLAPIRIVALTASALPDEIRQTREAGCDMHLTKPLRMPDLQAALS